MGHDGHHEIIKMLDKIDGGRWSSRDTFRDFCLMVDATLESLPAHYAEIHKTGTWAPDPPETAKLWADMTAKYGKPAWETFARCFTILLEHDKEDYLGAVFEEWVTQGHNGQFFTPWNLCKFMSAMMIGDRDDGGVPELSVQVVAKYVLTPIGAAHVAMTSVEHVSEWVTHNLETATLALGEGIQELTPISISDPCCGSGRMLMAAVLQLPEWVRRMNLVYVSGIDIDADCVLMTKINMTLLGVNFHARCVNALLDVDWKNLPSHVREAYEGPLPVDPAARDETIKEIRDSILKQGNLL